MSNFAFERFPREYSLAYEGRLSEVLRGARDMPSIWMPARVLRAVVDSTLNDRDRHRLVRNTTEWILDKYAGTAVTQFEPLADELLRCLGNCWISQEDDEVTANATTSVKAETAAKRLNVATKASMLMIALCHGGAPAAFQTHLYARQDGFEDIVYPVRFSRYKAHDDAPLTDPVMLHYLRDKAQGRTVVIYDEDASTGTTILEAVNHFRKELSPSRIIGAVNNDDRNVQMIHAQGLMWEK